MIAPLTIMLIQGYTCALVNKNLTAYVFAALCDQGHLEEKTWSSYVKDAEQLKANMRFRYEVILQRHFGLSTLKST